MNPSINYKIEWFLSVAYYFFNPRAKFKSTLKLTFPLYTMVDSLCLLSNFRFTSGPEIYQIYRGALSQLFKSCATLDTSICLIIITSMWSFKEAVYDLQEDISNSCITRLSIKCTDTSQFRYIHILWDFYGS